MTGWIAPAALALLMASCGDGGAQPRSIALRLVLPVAPDPMAVVERLSLSADQPEFGRVAASFDADADRLELPAIAPGEGWTFELAGHAGGAVIALGRTCPVDVPAAGEIPEIALPFALVRRFSAVGAPAHERAAATLLPLEGGDLLVLGGAPAERYRRDLAGFEPAQGPDGALVAAPLRDGAYLVVGEVGEAWMLAADGEASPLGAVEPRAGSALAPLDDGRALLVGGVDADGALRADTLVFDPSRREFLPGPALVASRRGATATAAPGGALVVGGVGMKGAVVLVERVDAGGAEAIGTLAHGRAEHTATVVGDALLVIGGRDADGVALASVERVRPNEGRVEAVEPLPMPRFGHTATALSDGRVLVAGGFEAGGTPIDRALLWDQAEEGFLPTDRLLRARGGHAAVVACDGSVLFVGGVGMGADRGEIYEPAPLE
ncbi:MAG: kelch repeat-containing protein [Myxococcota bacterium]